MPQSPIGNAFVAHHTAGEFKLEDVSPALLFRVLVVTPGHEPTFFPKTDPRKGPLEAVVKLRSSAHPPKHPGAPHLNLEGTRTDDDGQFILERVPPGEWTIGTASL